MYIYTPTYTCVYVSNKDIYIKEWTLKIMGLVNSEFVEFVDVE